MKLFLSLLLALLLQWTTGCAGARPAVTPPGPHFSVLTWNVNYGMPGPQAVADTLGEADADVVCLQETTAAWEAYLRPRLSGRYPHVVFRHRGGAGGLAFLSKHPLTELEWIEPPRDGESGWFPAWLVRVDVPGGPVQVLSVHLRPPVSDEGSFLSGYYETKPVRRREIERVAEYLRPIEEMPALIVGDFNEDESGRAVAWLHERGYTDALREFDRSAQTWRWRTSVGTLKDRLDYVMYSPRLECYGAQVLRAGASDHYPIAAVLGRAER